LRVALLGRREAMIATRWQNLIRILGGVVLAASGVSVSVGAAPVASADCASGFVRNPFTPECLAPVNTPTINGVPCVASKIALCSSFVQNQQPQRVPQSSFG
ncbi:MAG: hypothetical protein ACR2JM_15420, partial [Mycobacterium sp.]